MNTPSLPVRTLLTALVAALVVATPALAAGTGAAAGATSSVLLMSALRAILFAGLIFATIAAFKIPGTGFAETVVVAFLAAIIVPAAVTGTAQWYEIIAIVVGITLIALEVFVIPGLGATGLLGLILTLSGFLLIFVADPMREGHFNLIQLRDAMATLITGGVGGIAAFIGLGHYLPNIPRAHRLILSETNAPDANITPWPLPGDVGVCLTDLKPGGVARLVHVEGEPRNVDVVSDRGYIPAGAAIVVAVIEGSRVIVRPEPTAEVT